MWPAFLMGLLSEFFSDSKEPGKFIMKWLASGVVGLVLDLVALLLISNEASALVGLNTSSWTNISLQFILVPFVAAFIALIIVKSARYVSNPKQ
jgi:hypothetical protein